MLAGVVARSAVAAILVVTLFPYRFELPLHAEAGWAYYSVGGMLRDVLANVALFVPLGFGIAAAVEARRARRLVALVVVLASILAVSLGVETLQGMVPGRHTSILDVMGNGAGGVLGFGCHRRWGPSLCRRLMSVPHRTIAALASLRVRAGVMGYVLAVLALTLATLHWVTSLGNWDSSFPLVVGNEPTGDRPWSGSIHRLEILDRAISTDEARAVAVNGRLGSRAGTVLARYDFRAAAPFGDQTRHLPDLEWRGPGAPGPTRLPATLTRHVWLQSSRPAEDLTLRLRRSGQFTVTVVCAAADVPQKGPARIVSVSRSPYERNLTIGQEGADAVVRLRTPFTGENGTPPELRVAEVFEAGRVRRLTATYDGSVVRLFVDGAASGRLYLDPEPRALVVDFFTSARGVDTWAARLFGPADISRSLALYHLATFVPLGLFMTGMIGYRRSRRAVALLVIGGIVLPSVVTESLVSGLGGPPFNVGNVLLGAFLGGAPVFSLTWRPGPGGAAPSGDPVA